VDHPAGENISRVEAAGEVPLLVAFYEELIS